MEKNDFQDFLSDLNCYMLSFEQDKNIKYSWANTGSGFWDWELDDFMTNFSDHPSIVLIKKHHQVLNFSKDFYLDTRWPNLKSAIKDITNPKGTYTLFECLMVINICKYHINHKHQLKYCITLWDFLWYWSQSAPISEQMIAKAYLLFMDLIYS